MYTVGESKDSNSVVASLDTRTAHFSQASVAQYDDVDHSNVGTGVNKTAPESGAHFPNESKGQLNDSNIPPFQALRLSPGKSASNPVMRQTQSANNLAHEQSANRCHGTGEDSTPHQSNGMTGTSSFEGGGSMHKVPHIALGGSGSGSDADDSLGVQSQEQQQQGLESEGDKPPGFVHDSIDPKLWHLSPGNTPDFSVSGVGAEPVDCFCSAQSDEHGLVEHPTDKPTKEKKMSTGDPLGATTTSSPPIGPLSPQDARITGAPLPVTARPLFSGKLTRFWDGDTLPQQPCFQHMPAIAYDELSYYKTKQVPPFTSEDSGCVTVNKTQEQRLLGCDGTFLVESNEHGACLLSTAASSVGTGVDTVVASPMDSDCIQTTGSNSAPQQSPSEVDTARETSSMQVLGSSGSCECSVTTSSPTTRTHSNKQELGQRGNSSTNASVCKLEECKQTNTSHTSSKKYFDLDQASQDLPRGGSDSIIPLGATALTMPPAGSSDNRLSTGPLAQTMKLAVTVDKPLIASPLILEREGAQGPREKDEKGVGGQGRSAGCDAVSTPNM